MRTVYSHRELSEREIDALTEAVLDHEHRLKAMTSEERERYRPMAALRGEFIADHLAQRGWQLIPPAS